MDKLVLMQNVDLDKHNGSNSRGKWSKFTSNYIKKCVVWQIFDKYTNHWLTRFSYRCLQIKKNAKSKSRRVEGGVASGFPSADPGELAKLNHKSP